MSLLNKLAGTREHLANPATVKEKVLNSVEGVTRWVEKHGFRAYDPGDGDLSFLRYLTLNSHFPKRLLTASVLRAPFHIRPWIGIRPHTSTKGMGYMGWGYVKMYSRTRSEGYRRQADYCFDWLMNNRSPGWEQFCWGNNFSFSTRAGTIPKYTPTIVWSSLIALAFLEACEVLEDQEYFKVAASTADWVMRLPRERTSRGDCLSYVPFGQSSIHNSNMLGAALLARVALRTNDDGVLEVARNAMAYSCARQNSDGSWYYGEAIRYHWIDNFHTGYNLDCLKKYIDSSGDREFEPNLKLGLQYFKENFFEEDGRPKYYHDKAMPTDIQCAAQSIDTLAFFSEIDPECLELSAKVAWWTINNMQSPDGHFYYRDIGWKKVRTPMFHWGQATMFKALAHLLIKVDANVSGLSRSVSYETVRAGI
ncbi:MAG: hypothetical protein P4L87_03560 [Formivibrio sp.]|nr:hypothetical protein [Formivibrio sp.]